MGVVEPYEGLRVVRADGVVDVFTTEDRKAVTHYPKTEPGGMLVIHLLDVRGGRRRDVVAAVYGPSGWLRVDGGGLPPRFPEPITPGSRPVDHDD